MSAHDRYESSDDEPLRQLQTRLQTEYATRHTASQPHSHNRQPLLSQVPGQPFDEKDYQRYHDFEDGDDTDYDEEDAPGCRDMEHKGSCVNRVGAPVRSRRGAKWFTFLIGIGFVIFTCLHWTVYPALADLEMMQGELQDNGEEMVETIGAAKGGDFQHGAVKIQSLDEQFLPGGENDPHGKRRLVFIGDIHGCKDELLKLLKKVDFDPSLDHLIATGDVINKGPHSAGVLDHLIHLNATTVRGNHEDRLIHTAKSTYNTFVSPTDGTMQALQETDSFVDLTSASRRDAHTLKKLHPRHLRYIQHMPLILRIRPLPQALKTSTSPNSPIAEEILVVHAGLVPALPLEKQDPYYVTNMRSLHAKSHVPSADRAGKKKKVRHNKPWRNIWNWYNDRLYRHKSTKGFRKSDKSVQDNVQSAEKRDLGSDAESFLGSFLASAKDTVRDYVGRSKHHDEKHDKPQVVVYGHDAKSGLRIKRWSKGMDSGCVGGGKLSALVLNAKGQGEVIHVGCRQYW